MRLLTCFFASASDFLASYSDEPSEGVLHCRTRTRVALGEPVVVEVSFPGLPNRTLVRGEAVAVDRGEAVDVRLDPTDSHSRDYVLGRARGELSIDDHVDRNHRRIPMCVPVTCRIEEVDDPPTERLVGMTRDVGGGGAWVEASSTPPAVGTRVSLVLGPEATGGPTFRVDGRVAWLRRENGRQGFGVRFDFKESRDIRRLRALLRRACESGWVGLPGGPVSASRARG